jgi:polyketide cyclase/dehydrase/lipid transport protein
VEPGGPHPAAQSQDGDLTPDDQVSLHIAASPERLYELVSEVTNMGRWSPETRRARWVDGSSVPVVGAKFKGSNSWRWVRWRTTVHVEAAEPGREFTFCTVFRGNRATKWSYRFQLVAGGTLVTETRTRIAKVNPEYAFERVFMQGHEASFKHSMLATLRRLKAHAEANRAGPTRESA